MSLRGKILVRITDEKRGMRVTGIWTAHSVYRAKKKFYLQQTPLQSERLRTKILV